ncbi:2-polyprenyl-3-methyl-5-hydroxy-6-metoxy-1,4-benzoquinol methylase [Gillisia sp. Hel_I_86]|uniref:class I SAM-dependent methyltransferase n=1 Tax=Gillisia sp. Hel_I_86 TaxID=1249981 RepID=UPI00119C36D6|nr:class I SAM-dependent methyltransferase [Gillisia sp. Hel_I_86]TVZ27861.1 2-polyprenyl-3-methyl-5-hydroxy-6-metoxy-1,4-benzoquinol methylase [Gillisia sp. Hel_I_86]
MDYKNKSKKYYNNQRTEMSAYLPSFANKIIDIGCGDGAFGSTLKKNANVEVWGIELMQEEAMKASKKLDKVLAGNCETLMHELPNDYFDAIYFNDVLEHMVNPYEVLKFIKSKLSPNGVIISSIPNMRHYKTFKNLVIDKKWTYTDSGTMDFTHLRFFTTKSIQEMYLNLGFEIVTHKGIQKTKSIKPYLYNIPLLFSAMDIFYLQFATVVKVS